MAALLYTSNWFIAESVRFFEPRGSDMAESAAFLDKPINDLGTYARHALLHHHLPMRLETAFPCPPLLPSYPSCLTLL